MSLIHCSFCGKREAPKYAQCTWAWQNANRERVAWRQRLCPGCFAVNVLALEKDVAATDPLTCPACGIDTEHDYDAVYLTAYVPGAGKIRYEWPLCAPHAVEVRIRAQENAERLEDRQLGASPQAPSQDDAPDVWASLGIRPRE